MKTQDQSRALPVAAQYVSCDLPNGPALFAKTRENMRVVAFFSDDCEREERALVVAACNSYSAFENHLRLLVERYENREQWNAGDERDFFKSARAALALAKEGTQ